jgi:hypothetical protein
MHYDASVAWSTWGTSNGVKVETLVDHGDSEFEHFRASIVCDCDFFSMAKLLTNDANSMQWNCLVD